MDHRQGEKQNARGLGSRRLVNVAPLHRAQLNPENDHINRFYPTLVLDNFIIHSLFLSDGSEGLIIYVCTKWSRNDIEAADRKRLDDLESLVSMRAGSSHSRSTWRGRGIMHQNLIAHARYDRRTMKHKKRLNPSGRGWLE